MVQLKSKPALVIVDMMGMDISNHVAVINSIRRLLSVARTISIPVIFTRLSWNADYSDSGIIVDRFPDIRAHRGFIRGEWDAEMVDELKPGESDGCLIIDKTQNSSFWKTELEDKLHEMGVNQLIVTGVGTNVCVEATVRDAFANGFYTIAVSDGTATITTEAHEASIKSMLWFADIATVAEIEEALLPR
jgi:ureidoacrylate peracid hydrolase